VLNALIDKIGITSFRAEDLLVPMLEGLDERHTGKVQDLSSTADVMDKSSTVITWKGTERQIERAQTQTRLLRVKKYKGLGANITFHYGGNECEVIFKSIAPVNVAHFLTKLVVQGNYYMDDCLFDYLGKQLSHLKCLKLQFRWTKTSLISENSFSEIFVNLIELKKLAISACPKLASCHVVSPTLRVLRLGHLDIVEDICLETPRLRKLRLGCTERKVKGVKNCSEKLEFIMFDRE